MKFGQSMGNTYIVECFLTWEETHPWDPKCLKTEREMTEPILGQTKLCPAAPTFNDWIYNILDIQTLALPTNN